MGNGKLASNEKNRRPDLDTVSSSFDVLKTSFPDYEDRPEQREMAGEISECLKGGKNLLYDLLSDFNILPFHKHLIIDEATEVEGVISHVMGTILNYPRVAWLLYRLKGLKIIVDPLFPRVESFFKGADIPSQKVFPIPDSIIEKLQGLKKTLALNKIISTLKKNMRKRGGIQTGEL